MFRVRNFSRLQIALLVLMVVLASTAKLEAREKEFKGKAQPLGAGHVRSWFRIDAKGRPMAIGVSLDARCLEALPENEEEVILSLPPEALAATGLDHISIDWNPHGHIPAGIYDKPHFDFHFYLASIRETEDFKSEEIALRSPQADLVPAGYVMAPGSFRPGQGMHYANLESGELHGAGFRHTFIFGFYDGRMTFMEPMISLDYLRSAESDHGDVHQPHVYPEQGRYFPHGYSVTYDKKHKRYLIALHDFAQH